ncbi:MAG: metallophosphoesterase [Muribaculaceae bacterium]|nr:metallophosphoesterase [Muribaculaceae bacterium]
MRFQLLTAIVAILVCLLADLYIYMHLRRRSGTAARTVYTVVTLLQYAAIVTAIVMSRLHSPNLIVMMWLIFSFLSLLVPKIVWVLFNLIASVPRAFGHGRLRWLSLTGTALAVLLFGGMWWGALVNRNRIAVSRVTVESRDWPEAFDGMTIAQISDLHVGTWGSDTTFVSKLVDRVNGLHPDMIVFTGDIVNRQSDEFAPFVKPFSRLSAPDGVYAILGNHDYSVYKWWPSDSAREADHSQLIEMHRSTGHRLLLDENVKLGRGNDSIVIIGVENISKPPYYSCGSLSRAYRAVNDSLPKILLSHDPNHWLDEVADNRDANIALTLSGHTHAMQIQLGGRTPASWMYRTPWGLYTDSIGRHLYVNRGSGTVGMPMRLGATPEITLITLKRAD